MAELSEIEILIGKLQKRPLGAGSGGDVAKIRAQMEGMALRAAPDIQVEARDAGGVKAEWLVPPGAAAGRVIQYLHGGGYVIGSPNTHRSLAGELARAAGAAALVLDYRLAPENPYPAAVDDSVAAYRWLLAGGHAPEDVVLAGDSAGGGLVVATLLALKDAGLPMPAAGISISPWCDMTGTGESVTARAALDPMTNAEGLGRMAAHYLNGADPKTPGASPIFGNLGRLPPLLIHVGECEILFSDSDTLHKRAAAAGVDVTFEEWPRMIHVWHAFHPFLAEARTAIKQAGAFARARMGRKAAA
jgi:acetyl esterase/lipase